MECKPLHPKHCGNKPGQVTEYPTIYMRELNWYRHDFRTPIGRLTFNGFRVYDAIEKKTHRVLGGVFWEGVKGEYIFIQEVEIDWTSELLGNVKEFMDTRQEKRKK